MSLKSKKQILDLLYTKDDSASAEMERLLNNWTSFNQEKFTPERFAKYLLRKSERFKKLDMVFASKRFAETAKQILSAKTK